MDGNYIKLYRSMLDWEWYRNINTKIVFLHCLLKSNWKDGKFEGTTVPRGSFITSVKQLSLELCLTEDEVRTALKHLLQTGEITKQTTNKYTVITVVRYDFYQSVTEQNPDRYQTDTKQLPNEPQTIPKLFPTIEEKKEYKEGKKRRKEEGKKEGANAPKKKVPPVYYPADEKLDRVFADYVEMRKQLKKPMTDRAVELAINKLQKLSGGDNDLAAQIIEQSVMNSWLGLFPLKDGGGKDAGATVFDEWRDA